MRSTPVCSMRCRTGVPPDCAAARPAPMASESKSRVDSTRSSGRRCARGWIMEFPVQRKRRQAELALGRLHRFGPVLVLLPLCCGLRAGGHCSTGASGSTIVTAGSVARRATGGPQAGVDGAFPYGLVRLESAGGACYAPFRALRAGHRGETLGPARARALLFLSRPQARGLRRLRRGRAEVVYNAGYLAPRRPVVSDAGARPRVQAA